MDYNEMAMRTLDSNRNLFWIYVLKRVSLAVLTLFVLSVIIFSIFYGKIEQAKEESFRRYIEKSGVLIHPGPEKSHIQQYVEQYIEWVGGIFRGELVVSVDYKPSWLPD